MLQDFLSRVREVLGERFVGLYLYGSLATGDFDPRRSDIDFLVVTDGELPEPVIAGLETMHKSIWATGSKWAAKLEGTYLPRQELRRHDPGYPPRPTVNEGRFYLGREGNDWVLQRHVLREWETILAGPSIKEWIDPVSPADMRRAVKELLHEWWAPMLANPSRLRDPEYQPYAVLSMCRALYLLEHGAVATKAAAAEWAMAALGAEWRDLIGDALAWRRGDPEGSVERTLALMEFTIRSSERGEPASGQP